MVMRIRISFNADPYLVLQVNADSDPGFSWLKIEQNLQLKLFLCSKIQFYFTYPEPP
jgi:hypothetical protein